MNAAALLTLQQVDSAIDALGHRRRRLDEVATHAATRAALDEVRAAIATCDREVAEAGARIDRAEHDGAVLSVSRQRLEAQLKTVIAPREAEALMAEIATLDTRQSALDDAELVAMEEQANAEARRAELTFAEPAAIAAEQVAAASLAAATAVLDRELATLTEQRREAAAALDEVETTAYERARRQFGGVAVASLVGHRCSGCHLDLSPVEIDIVKSTPAGEPAECPQCSRFLVR